MPRTLRRTSGLLAASLTLLGSALVAAPAPSVAEVAVDFYTPPTSLAGAVPGDVVKEEHTVVKAEPTGLIGVPVTARRMMYVSTNRAGEAVAVTGTVLTPVARWSGRGERPVVGYAVGTQGLADRCAPSKQMALGTEYEMPFIELMLAKGWSLVITDYPGLGTPGDHPYVQRVDLGHAVLDAVRAARNLSTGGVSRTAPVVISGYSEGGTAAAGALELQPTYAPDVQPVAGFVGAAAADFVMLAHHLEGNLQSFLLGYTTIGLRVSRPDLPIDSSLSAYGKQRFARLNDTCIPDAIATQQYFPTRKMTTDGSTIEELTARPEFAAALADMKLGRTAPTVPVMLGHSVLDEVLPYRQAVNLNRDWCARGGQVKFVPTLVPEHIGGSIGLYPAAVTFLDDRLKGKPFVSTCR
ncbi:hypothetical protein ABIE44_001803 [Marmoricola sp. OAE513]|uniref:lipase family protein n=1 Tax=Marmoricola sp. OAE513 TaxID=2817894 RepID=UPI001AEB91A1